MICFKYQYKKTPPPPYRSDFFDCQFFDAVNFLTLWVALFDTVNFLTLRSQKNPDNLLQLVGLLPKCKRSLYETLTVVPKKFVIRLLKDIVKPFSFIILLFNDLTIFDLSLSGRKRPFVVS